MVEKKIKFLSKGLSFRLKGTEKGAAHRCRRPGTLRVHMALIVKARNAASGRDLGGVIAERVKKKKILRKELSFELKGTEKGAACWFCDWVFVFFVQCCLGGSL